MKKDEMARAVASRIDGVTIIQARTVIDTFFDVLTEVLLAGGQFNQKNFCTFKNCLRAARKGRNPQTREIVEIPPAHSLKLVLSNKLKQKLNSDKESNKNK